MADAVVLIAILIPAFASVFLFLIKSEGTKGLVEKPYRTKDGEKRTAKKERTNYIV